jgi:hypothetical protein
MTIPTLQSLGDLTKEDDQMIIILRAVQFRGISTHISSLNDSAVIERKQKKDLTSPVPIGKERLDALEAYWKQKEHLAQEQRRNGVTIP